MRIALLTTETPHHAYFAREISRQFPIDLILNEVTSLKAPFETSHAFETVRESYEKEVWFAGNNPSLAEASGVEVKSFPSMNDDEAVGCLNELSPDVVVVFGTGLLRAPIIAACPNGMINLHGGDPEEYRGLDTHMWSIYHHDFNGLVTTLHHVDPTLDNGDIIGKQSIPITPGMNLHNLRRSNTEVCLELTQNALKNHQEKGVFQSAPQVKKGRMYSFMPTALKEICVKRFKNYTGTLS
jgi:methionyl-tRNA formyltransferase